MKLKHLRREKDGRVYVRRNGRSIRLRAATGSDAVHLGIRAGYRGYWLSEGQRQASGARFICLANPTLLRLGRVPTARPSH